MRFSLLKLSAGILSILILTSCTAGGKRGGKPASAVGGSSAVSSVSSFTPAADLTAEAKAMGTSPGHLALAEIICRLDSSNVLEDLVSKNTSQTLLEILRETALQKSTTLEALDEKYGLADILASEKIYVLISSNAVSNQPAPQQTPTAGNSWIPKFQSAITSADS